MNGCKSLLAFATLAAVGTLWGAGSASAQTPNCDSATGAVDLFSKGRFEDFIDSPSGSGLPCTRSMP